jgi:hypothetical protein
MAIAMLECIPLETVERPDGYALRFPAEALECVERFVASERRACPALDFEIRLSGADRSLWLTVLAPSASALP